MTHVWFLPWIYGSIVSIHLTVKNLNFSSYLASQLKCEVRNKYMCPWCSKIFLRSKNATRYKLPITMIFMYVRIEIFWFINCFMKQTFCQLIKGFSATVCIQVKTLNSILTCWFCSWNMKWETDISDFYRRLYKIMKSIISKWYHYPQMEPHTRAIVNKQCYLYS